MSNTPVESRIEKILSEQALMRDNDFHVVLDIDPVMPGHAISVAKRPAAGLLDIGTGAVQRLLANEELSQIFPNGVAFIERGRAPFCTSLNGPHRAHAHFFPLEKLDPNWMTELHREVGGVLIDEIAEINTENDSGEYLLFGSAQTGFVYKSNLIHLEKRFIRRRIAAQMRRY